MNKKICEKSGPVLDTLQKDLGVGKNAINDGDTYAPSIEKFQQSA